MPKGISETDVHQAADALVAQGERPTVERIRAHLGTGSPNTVTRWLETWWQRLDERLQARSSGLAAGNPPADVASLAQQWWEVAVTHAHTVASQALADAHTDVQTRTEALAASEAQIANERIAWSEERTGLIHARDLAQRGVSDLEAHVQTLDRQLEEAWRQHAQVDAERESLLAQLMATQTVARETATAANTERTQREQAHRDTEDRWMREVDRARQDTARLAATLAEREKAISRAAAAYEELERRLRHAEMDVATHLVRSAAQAEELARLHGSLKTIGMGRAAKATRSPRATSKQQAIAKSR
jgi:chromosome segregation ATPase